MSTAKGVGVVAVYTVFNVLPAAGTTKTEPLVAMTWPYWNEVEANEPRAVILPNSASPLAVMRQPDEPEANVLLSIRACAPSRWICVTPAPTCTLPENVPELALIVPLTGALLAVNAPVVVTENGAEAAAALPAQMR